MSDTPSSSNPTLATAQKTFVNGDKKIATSKDARRVFGKSMADITAAVDAARAKAMPGGHSVQGSPGPTERTVAPAAAAEVAGDPDTEATEPEPAAATPEPATATPDPLRAREAKLVEQQTRIAREKREFESYKSKVESELAEARELRRLSQSDPMAYFEKYHGIKREAFVQVMGQHAQPKQAGPQTQLPQEIAQELHESRQFRAQLEQERYETRRIAEADRFAQEASAGSDKWPLASRYSPERLKARGWDVASAHAQRGVVLTNAEILDKIEEELADVAQLVKPQSKPKQALTPVAVTTGQAGNTAAQPTLSARSDSQGSPANINTHPTNKNRIADGVRAVEALLNKRT
jgi:hypothetical protein